MGGGTKRKIEAATPPMPASVKEEPVSTKKVKLEQEERKEDEKEEVRSEWISLDIQISRRKSVVESINDVTYMYFYISPT